MSKHQYRCPHCSQTIIGPAPAAVARTLQCPHCGKALKLSAQPAPPISEPPDAPPVPPPYSPPPTIETSPPPPSVVAQVKKMVWLQAGLVGLAIFIAIIVMWFRADDPEAWAEATIKRLVTVVVIAVMTVFHLMFWGLQYAFLVYFLVRHTYHFRQATFYFLWLWFPLLPLLVQLFCWVLEVPTDNPSLFFSIVSAAAWIYFTRGLSQWLAPKLASLFVKTFTCPGCYEAYDAYGQWSCSCGYKDYRDNRHLMRFRCPMCKKYAGHTECQRCGVTIVL